MEEAAAKFRAGRKSAEGKEGNSDESPKEAAPAEAQNLPAAGLLIPIPGTEIPESPQVSEMAEPAAPEAVPVKVRPASTRSSAPLLVTSDLRVPEFPKFTTSGFENADPEYYTRQAESLFKFHRSNIRNSFEQLTLLLTVLTRKDEGQGDEGETAEAAQSLPGEHGQKHQSMASRD